MDLETEIPVWYLGRMKWISNLTHRSTCSDVIDAIVAADSSSSTDDYLLFESWRGVERPLKARCRLLKLWHSWAGESDNVTLTLRPRQELIQQDQKLRRELKRTDRAIRKLTSHAETSKEGGDCLVSYLCICRSILRAHTELERQQSLISRLTIDIERESEGEREDQIDLARLLAEVSRTLGNSRRLTEESDQLDEQINLTNEQIDRRQLLLDELELDVALDEQIDMTLDHDSLEGDEERVSTSPPPTVPPRTPTVSVCRPTAIVEPSPSSFVNCAMTPHKLKLSFNGKCRLPDSRLPDSRLPDSRLPDSDRRTIHIIPFPVRHSTSFTDPDDTPLITLV